MGVVTNLFRLKIFFVRWVNYIEFAIGLDIAGKDWARINLERVIDKSTMRNMVLTSWASTWRVRYAVNLLIDFGEKYF